MRLEGREGQHSPHYACHGKVLGGDFPPQNHTGKSNFNLRTTLIPRVRFKPGRQIKSLAIRAKASLSPCLEGHVSAVRAPEVARR